MCSHAYDLYCNDNTLDICGPVPSYGIQFNIILLFVAECLYSFYLGSRNDQARLIFNHEQFIFIYGIWITKR